MATVCTSFTRTVAFSTCHRAMNIIEAISERRSSRTFNGLHLDASTLNRIGESCLRLSARPAEGEPECFLNVGRPDIRLLPDFKADGLLGTYGVIKGACSFMVMAVKPEPAQQLLAGYIFERLLLLCTAEGIGTCWLGATFGKTDFQAEYSRLPGNDNSKHVAIVSPLGHRTPKTRFAERMMRRLVSADTRKPFVQIFQGIAPPSPDDIALIAARGKEAKPDMSVEQRLAIALECVRLAPSSSNSQPWRAVVNRNLKGRATSVSFTCTSAGRFTPYDMGIAYCHFAESCRYLGIAVSLRPGNSPYELEAVLESRPTKDV